MSGPATSGLILNIFSPPTHVLSFIKQSCGEDGSDGTGAGGEGLGGEGAGGEGLGGEGAGGEGLDGEGAGGEGLGGEGTGGVGAGGTIGGKQASELMMIMDRDRRNKK